MLGSALENSLESVTARRGGLGGVCCSSIGDGLCCVLSAVTAGGSSVTGCTRAFTRCSGHPGSHPNPIRAAFIVPMLWKRFGKPQFGIALTPQSPDSSFPCPWQSLDHLHSCNPRAQGAAVTPGAPLFLTPRRAGA